MSDRYKKGAIKKRSKELIPKLKQRILRAISLQDAKEKSTIIFDKLDGTKIILHFGCTNIIFVDFMLVNTQLIVTSIRKLIIFDGLKVSQYIYSEDEICQNYYYSYLKQHVISEIQNTDLFNTQIQ